MVLSVQDGDLIADGIAVVGTLVRKVTPPVRKLERPGSVQACFYSAGWGTL
jgi:hypothetical protein